MLIHPLASVSPQANLGDHVQIGPLSVVEAGVTIGSGCILESHVVIKTGTTLGENCRVSDGAVLGGLPQHVHCPSSPARSRSAPITRSARTSPSTGPCKPMGRRSSATIAC